ncbi:hypothetical protein ASZ90_015841 [hydrocarbon metagenome]|uniref:Uncharacterized protein n=1 Tax=hydrocarbon metagenome TaxID=938273 RepID=A0A0W8F0U0_9ZZZZ
MTGNECIWFLPPVFYRDPPGRHATRYPEQDPPNGLWARPRIPVVPGAFYFYPHLHNHSREIPYA